MADKTLGALRAEYKALIGKAPSPRLDAAGVQAKIDEHNAAKAVTEADSGAQGADAAAEGGDEPGGELQAPEGGDSADDAAAEAAPEAPAAPEGTAYVRHPEHVGCSFRGVEIVPGKEGLCLVPLSAVEELHAHGFELIR